MSTFHTLPHSQPSNFLSPHKSSIGTNLNTSKTTTTISATTITTPMILLLLHLFSSFVPVAASGRVDALPNVCPRKCKKTTVVKDCTENWGRVGTIPSFEGPFPRRSGVEPYDALCGTIDCVDGFCTLAATRPMFGAICRHTYCGGDDTKCQSGPQDLDFEGKCSLWSMEYPQHCSYRWCPPEKPIKKKIVPFVPENPLDWRPPRLCPTKCTGDADCIDPEGIYGALPRVEGVTPEGVNTNSACGYASCEMATGICILYAYEDAPAEYGCGFTKCLNEDQCQNAGPADLLPFRFGYCGGVNSPGPRDCEYHWCPSTLENEKASATESTSISITDYSSTTATTEATTTVTTMADTTVTTDATASTASTSTTSATTTGAIPTTTDHTKTFEDV